MPTAHVPIGVLEMLPQWQLDIVELTDITWKPGDEKRLTGFSKQDGACSTFTR